VRCFFLKDAFIKEKVKQKMNRILHFPTDGSGGPGKVGDSPNSIPSDSLKLPARSGQARVPETAEHLIQKFKLSEEDPRLALYSKVPFQDWLERERQATENLKSLLPNADHSLHCEATYASPYDRSSVGGYISCDATYLASLGPVLKDFADLWRSKFTDEFPINFLFNKVLKLPREILQIEPLLVSVKDLVGRLEFQKFNDRFKVRAEQFETVNNQSAECALTLYALKKYSTVALPLLNAPDAAKHLADLTDFVLRADFNDRSGYSIYSLHFYTDDLDSLVSGFGQEATKVSLSDYLEQKWQKMLEREAARKAFPPSQDRHRNEEHRLLIDDLLRLKDADKRSRDSEA